MISLYRLVTVDYIMLLGLCQVFSKWGLGNLRVFFATELRQFCERDSTLSCYPWSVGRVTLLVQAGLCSSERLGLLVTFITRVGDFVPRGQVLYLSVPIEAGTMSV